MKQITLVREKETKNKVRFEEPGDQQQLGTVYVPKSTLAALGNPDRLTVTLEAVTLEAVQAA
jgi:hypothetical protein